MLLQDVCLSVTRQYSVETAKHIKLFSPSCSHITLTLVFAVEKDVAYSDRDPPPKGGIECRGMKNRDFRPYRYIVETVQDADIVLRESEY